MNRGLIDYMTYAYTYLCKGRGVLNAGQVKAIQSGANTIADTAPMVLVQPDCPAGREQELTMEEARMINQHVNECVDWLMRIDNI